MKVTPVFSKESVVLILSANDLFTPYLAVMLYSVIQHSTTENTYDILVLYKDITAENRKKIKELSEGRANVSIRFVDVTEPLSGITFYTENRANLTEETYFRLLIPYILPDYAKALYLDCDMLACADVAELYHTDVSNVLLASSRDYPGLSALFSGAGAALREYRRNELHLECAEDYFLAGMLLLNLDAFRKTFSMEEVLTIASETPWHCHDQDMLNMICRDHVRLLSPEWDATEPWGNLPEPYRSQQTEANRAPKIIHFAGGQKPWLRANVMWQDLFWQVAINTPFFNQLLDDKMKAISPLPRDAVLMEFRNGQVGFRYILKCIRAWAHYKVMGKRPA